jgi:hypothetical protein
MKIDIARPIFLPPNSPTSATAGAWNMADERPETSSSSRTTAMFGANPSDESEMAAVAGERTTNQRRLVRSATTPMNGWRMLGICWAGTIRLAIARLRPSLSWMAGTSGPMKDG